MQKIIGILVIGLIFFSIYLVLAPRVIAQPTQYFSFVPQGGEGGNNVPTIGQFAASSTVYANMYSLINATVQDLDGSSQIVNATVQLNGTVILKYVAGTNTFSIGNDSNHYVTIDAGNCIKTTLNSTAYRLSWKVEFYWNYSLGSISVIETNTKVFDMVSSSTNSKTGLFTFEPRLIIGSAFADDSMVNPSQTIIFSGTVYYYGTSTAPEDSSGITTVVSLNGDVKGSTTNIPSGSFAIQVTGESSVAQYNYLVYAVTVRGGTATNKTAVVDVDKIECYDKGSSPSSPVSLGVSTVDWFRLRHQSNGAALQGSVNINGTAATWDPGYSYWYIAQVYNVNVTETYNVTSFTDSQYGITGYVNSIGNLSVTWQTQGGRVMPGSLL